jgi:hypothetical protein
MKTLLLSIAVALCGAVNCLAQPVAAQEHAAAAAMPEVCSAVASAYNRGNEDKLWGYPDPVDIVGDGKLRHVYIVEQGTAHVHSIVASTKPLTPAEQDNASSSEVDFYGSIGQDMVLDTEPHIFAFKGTYYVVYEGDGGPYDVVRPNVGELCTFKRHYTAVLSQDRAPALCRQARDGRTFNKIPTKKLVRKITVEDAATLDLPGPFSPSIMRYAKLKPDSATAPVTVGYFIYESSAGSGCTAKGVVLLHEHDIDKSPRNTALLAAEGNMTDCRGSNAYLIAANGETLIEVDGGEAAQQTAPARLLVRLKGDAIETVCKVDQKTSFTPAPIAKAQ